MNVEPARPIRSDHRWRNFWFAPTTPVNLGFLRFLLFGYLFWLYHDLDSSLWAYVPTLFWREWSRFDLLGLPPASVETLQLLDLIWKGALLSACVGLFTRSSATVSFVLGLYLLGLPQNYGKISHVPGLLLLAVLVMAVSRCGDALSIDAWSKRRRGMRAAAASGEYRWPVRMVWLLMAMAFFGAGLSKLTGTGWILSDNLRDQFVLHHYLGDRAPSTLGLYVAQSSALCALLATATVLVELLAPVALFSPRARRVLIPSLFLLQLGNALLLNVHREFPWAAMYLFWIPWDRVAEWLASRRRWAGRLSRKMTRKASARIS